jgi:glucokinase
MTDLVLAADLGGTNLRMAVVDSDGSFCHVTKRPVPKGVLPDGLISLIDEMAGGIREQMTGEYRAVAFTAPAPIPEDFDGVLTKLPNLGSVAGMNFTAELYELFGVPVIAENDATAAAIGEHWLGASRGVDNSVTVTLGTGIGGGIMINGNVVRGPDGIGGEIGHITVEPKGRQCKCGNIGCIEEYASATAIQRMATENGLKVTTALDVFDAWQSGNDVARSVFEEMGHYLGQMLAGLANALNTEMFVVCGGVANGWDAFAPSAQAEITKRAYPAAAARAKLVRGQLGDNAGILGAARSAFLRLNK